MPPPGDTVLQKCTFNRLHTIHVQKLSKTDWYGFRCKRPLSQSKEPHHKNLILIMHVIHFLIKERLTYILHKITLDIPRPLGPDIKGMTYRSK